MNVLIVTDISWDNHPIIKKRIDSLKENTIVNAFYGKQLLLIEKYCSENMLHLFRRSVDPKNVEISMLNILKHVKCVLAFTNFTEHNTPATFIIEACRLNKVPFFIFGQNNTGFIYNDDYYETKFKQILKTITPFDKCAELKIPDMILNKENSKYNTTIDTAIENLRGRYSEIKDVKEKNSIKFLYDKNEQKRLKQNKKSAKEIAYYDYKQRRKLWIKEIIPKI
tara:strand:+ start:2090 stop:2761 length:672 start_codon:yes stop_codon:yes gene_type:complete